MSKKRSVAVGERRPVEVCASWGCLKLKHWVFEGSVKTIVENQYEQGLSLSNKKGEKKALKDFSCLTRLTSSTKCLKSDSLLKKLAQVPQLEVLA